MCLILIRTYSLNFGGDVSTGSFHDRYNVGLVTVGGMLLVSLPLLISYLWSTSGTYQPFLEIIYNTLGFILFLTVGSLALDHYRNYAGGITPNTNDNMRGDMAGNNNNNKWFGTTNSTTLTDSTVGRFLGLNNTDNVNAGKALGVMRIETRDGFIKRN